VFRLRKWYFDLVTEDGTVFIGYSAHLMWGLFRAWYRATLFCRPDRPPQEAFTLQRSGAPERQRDGSIRWACVPLEVSGLWHPRSAPIERRLFECPSGEADWECVAPTAEVVLSLKGRELEGWGYAERLTLTTPPWKLGNGDLRWGRFVHPDTSVIWVEWDGSASHPLVLVDGVERPGSTMSVEEVAVPTAESRLELGPRRVLREGPVVDVLSPIPSLAQRLPGGLGLVFERKWLSPGRWVGTGTDPAAGWAIHEVVEWPSRDPR
jgi:hypothetical protein